MSAQPLNTAISVFQRVRSFRQDLRHESVEAITKRLRPLVMQIPGQEILTMVLGYDPTVRDFSPFGRNGQPVVRGPRKFKTWAYAQEFMPGVDFSFQIGRDKFIQNTPDQLARDLYKDLQNV